MRPGVDVISRALPPPRTPPTATGVGFVIGATVNGPQYQLVRSMSEYVAVFGDRSGVGDATFDSADVFFREGGNQLYVSRTNPGVGTLSVEPTASEAGKSGKSGAAVEPLALGTGIQAALDALTKLLGPGQVWIADAALAADPAAQGALLAHAAAANRVALLSCADGTAAGLTAAGTAVQTDANARYGALFAPSAVVPGVTPGTTRTVPYPAVQAGILARNDTVYSPNQPGAGRFGQSVFSLDVAGHYTDQEYADLNDASVTMARLLYNGVRTYGNRSCVDAQAVPDWAQFGWARLNMAIVALADQIGEGFIFACIDGRGHTLGDFEGALNAMLANFWEADALYGLTAQDAFGVDVGPTVNTPATIANGELHAVLSVRMSPSAEWVVIEIVKVAPNEALPALAA